MIRALFAAVLFLVLGTGVARAAAPQWTLDAAASKVGFTARQMQVPVPGAFKAFTAAIRFAPDDLAASRAEIVIDVTSVTTPNDDIEKEIKRPDWFSIEQFPEARFVATGFAHKDGATYAATGKLTLKGVTKDVVLPLAIKIADDPKDASLLRATAKGEVTVSRLAFGIGQGKWQETAIVSDEVVIQVDIAATRKK
jgi:polyisoprenoid-binding protein YceI